MQGLKITCSMVPRVMKSNVELIYNKPISHKRQFFKELAQGYNWYQCFLYFMLYRVFNTPIGKTRASYLEEEKEKDDDEAFFVKQKGFFHLYEILQTFSKCKVFFFWFGKHDSCANNHSDLKL